MDPRPGCPVGGPAAGPAQDAVDQLTLAVEGLVTAVEGGALDHLDTHGLIDLLQRVERIRNRIRRSTTPVPTPCEERGAPTP